MVTNKLVFLWVGEWQYGDWDDGGGGAIGVWDDPIEAMIWIDEEYELDKHKWGNSEDGFGCLGNNPHYEYIVRPFELNPKE